MKEISWTSAERQFTLELTQRQDTGEAGDGELAVRHRDEVVLRLAVRRLSMGPCNEWHALDLLDWRPGDWIGHFETCAWQARNCEQDLKDRYFRFLFRLDEADADVKTATAQELGPPDSVAQQQVATQLVVDRRP